MCAKPPTASAATIKVPDLHIFIEDLIRRWEIATKTHSPKNALNPTLSKQRSMGMFDKCVRALGWDY